MVSIDGWGSCCGLRRGRHHAAMEGGIVVPVAEGVAVPVAPVAGRIIQPRYNADYSSHVHYGKDRQFDRRWVWRWL